LNVPDTPGIAEVVQGERGIDEALRRVDDHVWLFPAGRVAGHAARVMNKVATTGLLVGLASRFDLVVADFPPLLDDGLGIVASRLMDTVVLVARAGETPMPCIAQASSLLAAPPAVILNSTRSKLPRFMRRLNGERA
jgi:Mrp family chromosome partitioning ATPase